MTALSLINKRLNKHFPLSDFDKAFWADTPNYPLVASNSQILFDEKKSKWNLTLEITGVTKNDLKLDVKEGLLSVSGEKTKGIHLGKFERHFELPQDVDLEKIEAEFTDGVLTVELPLTTQKISKSIEIK